MASRILYTCIPEAILRRSFMYVYPKCQDLLKLCQALEAFLAKMLHSRPTCIVLTLGALPVIPVYFLIYKSLSGDFSAEFPWLIRTGNFPCLL